MELGPIFRSLTRHKARFVLIVAEVALTLAIVANCVSLLFDTKKQLARASGFDDDNLIWVSYDPFGKEFDDANFTAQTIDADLAALRALPGVADATDSYFLPWVGGGSSFDLVVQGRQTAKVKSQLYPGDAHFFHTLGNSIVAGRNFTDAEYVASAGNGKPPIDSPVAISQGLARLLFKDEPAVGKTLATPSGKFVMHVVGVFDPFYNNYGSWQIHEYAVIYPARSTTTGGTSYLVRSTPGQRSAVVAAIEPRLMAIAKSRVVIPRTISAVKDQFNSSGATLIAVLDVLMALLGVVTALGIVGLTAFSVAERRRQIGTRRAMGATRRDILRHFLLENWLITALGTVLGAALAYALNIVVLNISAGAKLEWPIVAVGVALLWLLGQAAALGPAWRGTQVPPAIATRNV